MTETKLLIDTNILVYSIDKSEKEKHEIIKNFLFEAIRNPNLYISTQNLAEFSRIVTEKISNPLNIEKTKELIQSYSNAFNTIKYSKETIVDALLIKEKNKIHFWDSLIIATMQENGINTIITENEKDFNKAKIKIINPFKKD